ncbi:helix-turn-helix domain-containing protein [Qipengyuania sphaerica]|uniref:helix-turn-helix domain-containing protein n=1 Tax=Qipengyuania sphaerica TaxID=2867243 RepID=UPI001C87958A|nr:helix-turn-helix transcriptional regulator [Qipengyuania sphaerica]MBX7539905.1 helix-turn-helix transcriptional regulator [Qipengyuania sphaerica]
MTFAMTHDAFDDHAVGLRLREEIARRRMSRQTLAENARLSLSTLEKALAGRRRFTLATVVRLEEALGASLREIDEPQAQVPMLAPPEMGSYARPAVQWIEGEYVTLRASFGQADAIYAYRTQIRWSERKGHLVFAESDRIDDSFEQAGFVSMPHLSGHAYLMTGTSGQYRMIVLGRATHDGRMYGLLTTLQVGVGSQLVPVSSPVAFVPADQLENLQPGVHTLETGSGRLAADILDTATSADFCRMKI